MIWYGYLVPALLTLWVLKITYFFIKRRYHTQSSVVYQNSTEESDICASSEKVFNESSSESLNLDFEKKTMDINNVTGCSGYGSTEDEMQEIKNFTTTQDVLDTCKINSDSHSSIMSWESCNEEISHPGLDFVNCQSSENHPEICQPLNLCMRDNINETGINKITRTFFTDRKHKTIKAIHQTVQKINSEKYSVAKMIEAYDQRSSFDCEESKNLDRFENKERSLNYDKLEYNLDNTEHELKNANYLDITKMPSIHLDELKDEYSLNNTEHGLENVNNLEMTKLCFINHGELEEEYNLNNTEHELKDDNNYLQITEVPSIHHNESNDEFSLNNIEHGLENVNNLEMTKLSSIHHGELEDKLYLDNTEHELKEDNNYLQITEHSSIYHGELENEHNLDNTEHGLENVNNLEMTKFSSINHGELEDKYNLDNTEHEQKVENNLQITELFSKHHKELKDEYSLDNTEFSLNSDDVMLGNDSETIGISLIHQDEQSYEYPRRYLMTPELSSLNNNKSISGINSPNIKCHHDYEVLQDIDGLDKTSSSEFSDSLPSTIYNNDSSIDDIRYVEDFNDISFFESTFSDDAMNEAFVED